MALSLVVFDCDGVLLDSVPVKTRAFARLAQPYGDEAVSRFVAFHEAHGGVSRFQKFAWFFQNILNRPITEADSKAWGDRFQSICREELAACQCIPGAKEALTFLQGKIPLVVCSGAPAEEQKDILTLHGLAAFFDGIYGSPPPKAELLEQIVQSYAVSPQETLMVGDATTDRDAARACHTLFYGVGHSIKSQEYPWSEDLVAFIPFVQGVL
ncbi:MAG: HAD family hydrolase [Desulfovibrio sp.]|nr:HAD family hydrolase [Desulfovibrio sp.]